VQIKLPCSRRAIYEGREVLQEVRIISATLVLMCASACGSAEQSQSGKTSQIHFELVLGNLEIAAVGFTVEGGDFASPLKGQFSVPDAQDPPVWASIMELALEAYDPGGQVICAGSADFTVVSGKDTKVDVLLLRSGGV
jgi:hypothetical protein